MTPSFQPRRRSSPAYHPRDRPSPSIYSSSMISRLTNWQIQIAMASELWPAPLMSMNALTGNIGSIATCPIRPWVHNDALDALVGRRAGLVLVHLVAPHAGKLGF